VNKAENKALAYIKGIVIRIYTVKNIYTEEDIRKAKEIKYFDKRSAMFITNKAASQQSILPRNAREHTKGFANKLYI
jgi:hypothetical protein